MTYFSDLSEEEKQDVLDELEEEGATSETQEDVLSGHKCADCWMNYYNCLCSHDDD